jgi:hypothetical protein
LRSAARLSSIVSSHTTAVVVAKQQVKTFLRRDLSQVCTYLVEKSHVRLKPLVNLADLLNFLLASHIIKDAKTVKILSIQTKDIRRFPVVYYTTAALQEGF